MILDDEADYASQKARLGEPNPIHEKLVTVREPFPEIATLPTLQHRKRV